MPTLKPTGHRNPPALLTPAQIRERRADQARRAIKEGFAIESNLIRIKRHLRTRRSTELFLLEAKIDLKPIQHILDKVWPPKATVIGEAEVEGLGTLPIIKLNGPDDEKE